MSRENNIKLINKHIKDRGMIKWFFAEEKLGIKYITFYGFMRGKTTPNESVKRLICHEVEGTDMDWD